MQRFQFRDIRVGAVGTGVAISRYGSGSTKIMELLVLYTGWQNSLSMKGSIVISFTTLVQIYRLNRSC
jgi:hypothetical protein